MTLVKGIISYSICFFLLVFGLSGCVPVNNGGEYQSGKPQVNNGSKTVDDFKVSINVQQSQKVQKMYATITYMGDEPEIDIYHGGSIFFFNINQQDGDFEYEGAMNLPLLTTTLIRNKSHRVDFNGIEKFKLESGTYEFEAIANFSLDSNNIIESKMEIPVYCIAELE